jgi:hypothetical protein
MARKKNEGGKGKDAGKAPAPESRQAKPSEVRQVISEKEMEDFLRACRTTKEDMDELRGAIGGKTNAIVEKYGHTKWALGVCRNLDRLSPEKLAIELDDLEHLLEVAGLNERAKSAPSMDFAKGEDAGEEDGKMPDNVQRFPGLAAAE